MLQRLILFMSTLALSVAAVGCIHPTTTKLRLNSTSHTNGGRPLAVIVRTSDSLSFRNDSYADIERLFLEPDASVLQTLMVFPGQLRTRCIGFPYVRQSGYAVYALYANAQGDWKILYEPTTPYQLELWLGPNQIDVSRSREKRPLLSSRDAEFVAPAHPIKSLTPQEKSGESPVQSGGAEHGGNAKPSTAKQQAPEAFLPPAKLGRQAP
jgi:hypothetical protein